MIKTYLVYLCLLIGLSPQMLSCKKEAAKPPVTPVEEEAVIKPVMDILITDSAQIQAFLKQYPLFEFHGSEIHAFYAHRYYQGAWFNTYGIVEQAGQFVEQLNHFDDEGLKDSVIYFKNIQDLYKTVTEPGFNYAKNTDTLKQLELLLTAEFFVYAQKVWYGLSEKTTRSLDWYVNRKTIPSVSILDSILSGGKNAFTAFEPVYNQYGLLKQALKKYRSLSDEPWDSIYLPSGVRSIKPGEDYPVIQEIKRRLFLLGDLQMQDSTTQYDSITMIGVQLFQHRHGLLADGVMGEKFFRDINCTPTLRAQQIAINMERCRWLPNAPKGEYIMVNIPEYTMRIYDADTLSWEMRVVVGKTSTSTTIFNDELEYIVFSPYWIPPASIRNNEILPGLQKNPNYLAKQQMEAYDPSTGKTIDVSGVDWKSLTTLPYTVRQKPGNHNALGWVKFMFPNEHSIYFHDTPSRELFSRESRGFSHGCIRLEKPKEFAQYLLRNDTTFTAEKIDSLYYLGTENIVTLKQKIPVFIVYFTARVEPDGTVFFSRDIYGHDAKLEKTLYATAPANTDKTAVTEVK